MRPKRRLPQTADWRCHNSRCGFLVLLIGIFPLISDIPARADNVDEAGIWLRDKATELARRSARNMSGGRTAFVPQAAGGYDGFWLRDYEYMLEGSAGVFSATELTNAAVLFVESLRSDGAGVDTIKLDGTRIYQPGYGSMGTNPVADGSQFTVSVVWQTFQHLRDTSLLTRRVGSEPLIDRLVATMNAIPRNPANGLVRIDPDLPWDRCPYGFTDSVRMTGDVLFCSLLDVQASRQLADLFDSLGNTTEAAVWRARADSASAAIRQVFWDDSFGLFRAATVRCREHDIWGSAFAVHLGVATEAQADTVAAYFRDHYSQLVQAGQVRHLPGGVYWELASCAPNTYQNGGFWATATGWFTQTLARVDPQLADATLVAMVADFRLRGVNEWVFGNTLGVPGYTASATLPLAIWREMHDIPAAPQMTQVGGGIGAKNLALASVGAAPFAKDVISGYSQHTIAHLNDGIYGNGNSWLAGAASSFAGVAFNGPQTISAIAFGRDNGGEATQYTDRYIGTYSLQYTRVTSPGKTTPDSQWTTLATLYCDGRFPDGTGYLRHRYEFAPVANVTGIRMVVAATGNGDIAIDELEAYSGNSYAWWASTQAGGQTADKDHDHDGVPNGVEFLMGETVSTFTATPAVQVNAITGALSWTWPYDPNAIAAYKFQLSEDLVTWPPEMEIPHGDPRIVVTTSPDHITLTLPADPGAPTKFCRLVVTATP